MNENNFDHYLFVNGNSRTKTKEVYDKTWQMVDGEEVNAPHAEPTTDELAAIFYKLLAGKRKVSTGITQVTTSDVTHAGPVSKDKGKAGQLAFRHKISRNPDHDLFRDAYVASIQKNYENVDDQGKVWAQWVLAVAVTEVVRRDGQAAMSAPRIMRVAIDAHFVPPSGEYIDQTYNPNFNTGFKLIEFLKTLEPNQAEIWLSNYDDFEDGETEAAIQITPEAAELMIAKKELPQDLAEKLFKGGLVERKSYNYAGEWMAFWHFVTELDTIPPELLASAEPSSWRDHVQTWVAAWQLCLSALGYGSPQETELA